MFKTREGETEWQRERENRSLFIKINSGQKLCKIFFYIYHFSKTGADYILIPMGYNFIKLMEQILYTRFSWHIYWYAKPVQAQCDICLKRIVRLKNVGYYLACFDIQIDENYIIEIIFTFKIKKKEINKPAMLGYLFTSSNRVGRNIIIAERTLPVFNYTFLL